MSSHETSETATPKCNGRAVPDLVGCDEHVRELRAKITAVGARNSIVLIYGESGTGKELVARHIHAASSRSTGPCIVVDCTTMHATLFESQLFGHVKGAFTGAECSTLGLFRAADGGTLFLDEVGELDHDIQARLLRCIQERAVVPLGGVEPIPVDVRIVAATHRDLKDMVRRGDFRADLYYRLDVVRVHVPPLRDRPKCVAPLAEHFLTEQAQLHRESRRRLTAGVMAALETYPWPGNVRELRSALEYALAHGEESLIRIKDLPMAVRRCAAHGKRKGHAKCRQGNGRNIVTLETAERCLLKRALRATAGHRAQAAELLGVERHRLLRLIRRHGLETFAQS